MDASDAFILPHLRTSREHECHDPSDENHHHADSHRGNRDETGHHDIAAYQREQAVPENHHLSKGSGSINTFISVLVVKLPTDSRDWYYPHSGNHRKLKR